MAEREFNGRAYKCQHVFETRTRANERAKISRKKGYGARVIQERAEGTNCYAVYISRKPLRAR